MTDDPYRYCVDCGVDCHEDEPEHGPECPQTTGLWPVDEKTLNITECPACHHRFPLHGMVCMDCGAEFHLGDFHALRYTASDMAEVVCLGCAALTITGEMPA